jgi:rhamnosyltransferase subunit B
MSDVVISAFGTAGDIFPTIPVAKRLESRGYSVSFLTPRFLGLYPRSVGFRTITIGDGSERAALRDRALFTLRFGGMDSWRRCLVKYVLPMLLDYFEEFRAAIERESPSVVVTTALALWGPIAAEQLKIPWSSLHLYPQLTEATSKGERDGRFAAPLDRWLRMKERELHLEHRNIPALAWSIAGASTVSGHDPLLFGNDAHAAALGHPYWDRAFDHSPDLERALEFLSQDGPPRVVVSLGSYIGLVAPNFWKTVAGSLGTSQNVRLLLVGVGSEPVPSTGHLLAVSPVPLSQVLSHADLVIHHGGIGSTYAALLAGIPALVAPFAFDQSYNCGLLEKARVGFRLPDDPGVWESVIHKAIDDRVMRARSLQIAAQLIRPDSAAEEIAKRLLP